MLYHSFNVSIVSFRLFPFRLIFFEINYVAYYFSFQETDPFEVFRGCWSNGSLFQALLYAVYGYGVILCNFLFL